MKKRRFPALWLLMIPAQLVAGTLFYILGVRIDTGIFSGGGQGHGAPIFSVLFLIVAAVLTVVVILLSIILMAVGFSRRSREKREALLAQAAQTQRGAYTPQQYPPQPPSH